MEKMQAAIAQARKTRQTGEGVAPRAQPGGKRVTPAPDVEELWQALKPFDTQSARLRANRIVTKVANEHATPFDILRTKILLQMRQNGWKRIAITSPMPSSGKTTIASNLALGLSRQTDLRSMLLDLDLRDPSVANFFGVELKHGIGDVLSGHVDFADQAMRFGDNVAFSMASVPESDPTRLLLAEETVGVLDDIEARYKPDIMIFDLPSVLVNDDTRAFLKNVDCALIVVRANKTRYAQFDTCEQEIAEHTNVLGVALNAYRQAGASKSD